jgi:hypothetical protein
LKVGQQLWPLEHAVDVQALGQPAGKLESERGFLVAVGAGSTQNQNAGLRHKQFFEVTNRVVFAKRV